MRVSAFAGTRRIRTSEEVRTPADARSVRRDPENTHLTGTRRIRTSGEVRTPAGARNIERVRIDEDPENTHVCTRSLVEYSRQYARQ